MNSTWAYQLGDLLATSERLGFWTTQNHYDRVYREEERELLPLCHE